MAAALIEAIPVVGEVLSGIDAIGTELGVGNIATNTVIAEATNEAKKLVNPAIDAAFGAGTAASAESAIAQGASTLQDFFNDMGSGIPYGTTTRQRQKNALSNPLTAEQGAHLNATLAQKWIDFQRKGGCDCSAAGAVGTVTNAVPAILGPTFSKPQEIVGSAIDVAQDIYSEGGYMQTGGAHIVMSNPHEGKAVAPLPLGTSNGTVAGPTTIPPVPLELTYDDGRNLGSFIVAATFDTAEKGPDAGVEAILRNPDLFHVAKNFTEYLHAKNLQGLDYYAIRDTYNGLSISPIAVQINDAGHYWILDEIGSPQEYTGPSAPPGSNPLWLAANGFIPPIHGIWVGPKSPNNGLPVDLLDTYAMMHDIDYENGWFDQTGDFKLISRIENNYGRMGYLEAAVGRFTVKWFSTVGYALAQLKGALADPTTPATASGQGDVYEYIMAKQDFDATTLPVAAPTISVTVDKEAFYLNKPINAQARADFYAGITDAVQEAFMVRCPYTTERRAQTAAALMALSVVSLSD